MLIRSLAPLQNISKRAIATLAIGQLLLCTMFWAFGTDAVIPKPWEVLRAFHGLWDEGIVIQVMSSLTLYLEAVAIASLISLTVAYLSSIPVVLPFAVAIGKLRFLGMVGLPFLFTLYIHGVHNVKIGLEVFAITVFLVTGMLDVLDAIPSEKFDLARTLRMNNWQVVWEVLVLGRIDVAFDVIRQNAAIGWLMLPMIEGLFKSEGGLGALMDIQNRNFHLAEIAAIQILILGIGLAQDYLFGVAKHICCPYAQLLVGRK